MKQLRILTGAHAGVHLDLTPRRYVIGAEADADIQLIDWTTEPGVIDVNDQGNVLFGLQPAGTAAALQPLGDYVPQRQGPVVLCVGPLDADWPADADLLARLSQRAGHALLPRRPMAWAAGTIALLAMAGVGASMAGLNTVGDAAGGESAVAAAALQQRVQRALAGTTAAGLPVQVGGDSVSVGGLVDSAADAAALRQRLEAVAPGRVQHNYVAASAIAQRIAEGLGQPGATVRHQGGGVFVVAGVVDDAARAREGAARLAADFGDVVRRIEIDVKERGSAGQMPLRAMLSSEGLDYVQTRDGAKHLVLRPEPGPAELPAPANEGN